MKRKRWIKSLIIAVLAIWMGSFSVYGADHVSALKAAEESDSPITVKKYGEEEDSNYSFRLKRTDHTTCTWTDASGISSPQLFHQTRPGLERWGQLVTSDAQKGKISCYLTNMGSYKGKNTNLRITFTDWAFYQSESGKRYYPLLGVALSSDFYGLVFGDVWYEAKMEILDDQGRPLAVNMTYRADDLDYGQIFGVNQKDGIDGLAVPEDSRVYYIEKDGYYYFYAENIDSSEYDKDSVQVQYGKISSFSLRVGGGVAFPESFTFEKFASEKMEADYERFQKYLIGEPSVEVSDNAGALVGWIAGSAKGYGPFTPPVPTKSCDQAEVHGEEAFHYFVYFKVPECQPADYYKSLVLTDPIPEALSVDQVVVYDADNREDVSTEFFIQTSGKEPEVVKVSARDPSSDWIYGRSFEVRIQVHKRPEYVFGSSNIVSNKASLRVDQKAPRETETVKTAFYYQIITESENGSITKSNLKVPAGGEMEITYSPSEGYYLKSIHVDQTAIDKNQHHSNYSFTKINADHHIRVVYEKNPVLAITKEVSGKWDEFGTPTFLFEITGIDENGVSHTYYEALEISESFPEDGIYRKTFTLKIPAGIWNVRELQVSRYKMTEIKEVINGKVQGNTVTLDTENHNTAAATFCNEMTNYKDFSHNDLEVNLFGK